MGRTFDVLIERGLDGWYVASVPTLLGCHTQGKTTARATEVPRHHREEIDRWLLMKTVKAAKLEPDEFFA